LFGAGASYGSGCVFPRQPPLGFQLFSELQKRGGIAASVSAPINTLFQEHFETGMAAFFATRQSDVPTFLREMAAFFVEFAPGPGNAYVQLIERIVGSPHQIAIGTLNYDILIEAAITTVCATRPTASALGGLFKLHGSCNYFPDVLGQLRGVTFNNYFECIRTSKVHVAKSADEVRRLLKEEDSIAPVMALYAKGKRVLFASPFVDECQRRWQVAVGESDDVIVVGTALNEEDDHIWCPMARTKGRISYVGLKRDWHCFEEWSKRKARTGDVHLGERFWESVPAIINVLEHRHL
jgi:hypothetical protein